MNFAVVYRGVVIGYSDLEHEDLGMGVAHGAFRPTSAYEGLRPIFRIFAEGRSEEYYAARDALGLDLVNRNGTHVAHQTIHIVDYSVEAGDEAYELEVILKDSVSWQAERAL